MPILAIVHDLLGHLHLHRLPAGLRHHPRRPGNSTHLMATLAFQRGIPGGQLGEGAAIAVAMIPFLVVATLFSYFALAGASGSRERPMTDAAATAAGRRRRRATVAPEPMSWDSRARRMVTIYVPLALLRDRAAVPVLLDGDHRRSNRTPSSTTTRTTTRSGSARRRSTTSSTLLFETDYPRWLVTTMTVAVVRDLPVAVRQRARGLCDPAAALQGQPVCRAGDLPGLSGAALDPVHPAGDHGLPARPVRHAAGADPDLSDLPGAVLHLAADRLLQVDPLRAGGMRADRRRDAPADPAPDHPAAGGAGPDLAPASSPSRCPGTSSSTRWPSSRAARRRPCRWRS